LTASALEIDGIPVEREESPASAEELARLMKEAHAAGESMAAVGGGTKLHLGNPPRALNVALRTRGMRGVIEYHPDNLTVSVRAGTTLGELQETLRGENQFLPLDPPHPEQATLGGIVACNASGPLRFRYGTVRDSLIGIKVLHADGTASKAGGRLVKNVSGYDMCKLYAGSLGTLAILSELTFKVQPRTESAATAVIGFPSAAPALEASQAVLRADLVPEAVEAVNDRGYADLTGDNPTAPWILLIRFGETEAAVRWQLDRLRQVAAGSGGSVADTLDAAASAQLWQRAASAREGPDGAQRLLLKRSTLAQFLPGEASLLAAMGERLGARTSLFCHAGSGVLYGRHAWQDPGPPADDLRREIAAFRRACAPSGGHVVVEIVRTEVKRDLDVWGYEAPALDLMRRIKHQFDPKALLNPGRFVGGI
jgi:glycolate oxidase FAD binding subunit